MEIRKTGTSMGMGFDHEDHPLLHQQVRDRATGAEGELMAVVREPVGEVGGRQTWARTAYIRVPDGREVTAAPQTLDRL
ncbi:hypothetical protein ACFWBC_37945 [Streptomyces sp. NPDC059985]|uniref:hypothetical protein n=1 Tax=Streptomyces sp. NPDC059985 TaxID=3347025 RepID=UPI0036A59753